MHNVDSAIDEDSYYFQKTTKDSNIPSNLTELWRIWHLCAQFVEILAMYPDAFEDKNAADIIKLNYNSKRRENNYIFGYICYEQGFLWRYCVELSALILLN